VYREFTASLNLRWDRPKAEKPVNLGYVMKTGGHRMRTDTGAYSEYAAQLPAVKPAIEQFIAAIKQHDGAQS
jgi:hypothetical protein